MEEMALRELSSLGCHVALLDPGGRERLPTVRPVVTEDLGPR